MPSIYQPRRPRASPLWQRASGFTRLECPDCGHERLLAFTCKTRHYCPACHQRRVRSTSEWIAGSVCHQVPHRQVVFTIPKVLRGIFRKRRQLLSLLFQSAIDTLTESFRLQLALPGGKLGAIAAVHTFGDYLVFHPHLHVLVADGLFAPDGHFHCLPHGAIGPMTELFRHRFSIQKITWNASTQTVIYRSKRHHNTKGLGQK